MTRPRRMTIPEPYTIRTYGPTILLALATIALHGRHQPS